MKFVKALNQGIVTDLGMGQKVYQITMEGTEVPDDVAKRLKEIFGYNIDVLEINEATVIEETPTTVEPIITEPETLADVVTPAEVPVTEPTTTEPTPVVEETKTLEAEVIA